MGAVTIEIYTLDIQYIISWTSVLVISANFCFFIKNTYFSSKFV